MIQISVDTRRAVVTNKETLTAGSAGIQVEFTLSEDWDALSKLAVFRVGDDGTKVDVVLGESLTCAVPPEVLKDEDEVLFIGVYGTNGQGTVIIPTVWASAGVVKPGTEPNTPASAEPTPDIWAQILEVAQDAEQTAGDAMSMVEAGLASLTELEEGVEDAETVRAANELTRISNEEDRGIAETSRATAETGRANSETSRAAAEAGRVWKNNNFLVNGVSVTTLTPSTPATASLETTTDSTTGETAVTRLLLGIPQGAKGDPGDPGETLVSSVNEKTGAVVLDATDVGAYEKPATGIPATDLTSAVQTSLGKADSAYQKPAGGIPATDLASAVQTSLGKADSALQTAPVSSVNTKTGAVVLDAGDIEYDDEETYAAGSIGAEVSQQKNAISQLQPTATASDVDKALIVKTVDAQTGKPTSYEYGETGGGLSDTQKQALLNCFEHVAWTDSQGQTYYDELEDVLFPPAELLQIVATYSNSNDVYPDDSLDSLKPYITVTAYYSDSITKIVEAYILSGTLAVGTSVITVTYSDKTATINVTVVAKPKSDMTQWTDGVMYTDIEVVKNSYYTQSGSIAGYSGWDRTGHIPIHGASKIVFEPYQVSGATLQPGYCWFFKEDKTPLSYFDTGIKPYEQTTVTVPSGAYYFGISNANIYIAGVIQNGFTPYA